MNKAQAQALLELIADLYLIATRPEPADAPPPAPGPNGLKPSEPVVT